MKKITFLTGALALTGAVVLLQALPAAAQSCECVCTNADQEFDEEGAPILDDLQCCTSPTDENFDPTFANNGGFPCGCVAADGVASVNGRVVPEQDPRGLSFYIPQGCIDVGATSTADVFGRDCNEDAVDACRAGGCTTTTFDAPECAD